MVFSKNIRAALIVLRATITLPDGCQSKKRKTDGDSR
jgi:hypothetical protein